MVVARRTEKWRRSMQALRGTALPVTSSSPGGFAAQNEPQLASEAWFQGAAF
jgi:hypothetical protein